MDTNTYNRLMQALSGGADAQAILLEEIIAKRGINDPKTQLLMQYLTARQEAEPAADEMDAEEVIEHLPPPEYETPAPQASRQPINEVKDRVVALYQENQYLRELAEMFTRAVGACLCLGSNPNCAMCGGQGKPGAFQIDQQLYQELIAPAQPQYQVNNRSPVERLSKKQHNE